MERGEAERALQLAARIPIDRNASVDQLLTRAVAYTTAYLPAKAIPLLERVLEVEPSNQAAHFWLVIASSWSGYEDRCIEQGETYFSLFGEDPEVHLWVAVSHNRLGQLEEATVHYRRAWEMYSDIGARQDFYPWLAQFFMKVGRTDEALEILEGGIERSRSLLASNGDNVRVLTALGMAYALQGDRERFLATADQLLPLEGGQLSGVIWGYFLLGLDDLGAELFCRGVARRTLGGDFGEVLIRDAPASFWTNRRAQACLKELNRWQQELAARY